MSSIDRLLAPGHYRLTPGVYFVNEYVICDYPLRALKPGPTTLRLLQQCAEAHTCEELAKLSGIPIKRVEMLCDQLRWKGLLEAGPSLPLTNWPGVSIVIPTYNRAELLKRCLHALLQVDYPCLEIVVVDDGSTDETASMLKRIALEFAAKDIVLRVVKHASRQGVGTSRNTGARAASHEILAFIDSDCVASEQWLKELIPAFARKSLGAVGGMIRAYDHQYLLGRYEDARSSLFMGTRGQQVKLEGPMTYLPTANLLIRREAWEKPGGFAPMNFGEDVDFCRRLLLSGYEMLYLPQGTVFHDYRTDLQGFLKTRVSYASAEAALVQRHPEMQRVLFLPLEQALFAILVIGGIWGLIVKMIMLVCPTHGVREQACHPCVGTGECGAMERGPRACPRLGWGKTAALFDTFFVRGKTPGWSSGIFAPPPHPRDRHEAPTTPPHIPLSLRRVSPATQSISQIGMVFMAMILMLVSGGKRIAKVRKQGVPIRPIAVLRATMRGHLAYTYHLCRHLTRYYTLPMLVLSLLIPPLFALAFILCGVVIGVDYVRLRPEIGLGTFAICLILEDCAYEVGVVKGCIKQKTWKPLIPLIKSRERA